MKYDQYFFNNLLTYLGFKSVSNEKLDKGNHGMKWTFKHPVDGVTVEVIYASKASFFPPIMIKIHDPNKEFLDLLHSFFKFHNVSHKLSKLELTFDFITDEIYKLKEFLKSHLFMKQQRSESGSCKTTFYANNLRRSVRGMRVYPKLEKCCVRMELVMNGPLLRRLNITFPLDSIDQLDLRRFFTFMLLDQEHLRKYLIRCNRKQISESESDQRMPGMGRDLIMCLISSWIRSAVEDDYGEASMMKQVEILKSERGVPNYSRFLLPHEELQREFEKQVYGQTFLKSRHEPPWVNYRLNSPHILKKKLI